MSNLAGGRKAASTYEVEDSRRLEIHHPAPEDNILYIFLIVIITGQPFHVG